MHLCVHTSRLVTPFSVHASSSWQLSPSSPLLVPWFAKPRPLSVVTLCCAYRRRPGQASPFLSISTTDPRRLSVFLFSISSSFSTLHSPSLLQTLSQLPLPPFTFHVLPSTHPPLLPSSHPPLPPFPTIRDLFDIPSSFSAAYFSLYVVPRHPLDPLHHLLHLLLHISPSSITQPPLHASILPNPSSPSVSLTTRVFLPLRPTPSARHPLHHLLQAPPPSLPSMHPNSSTHRLRR